MSGVASESELLRGLARGKRQAAEVLVDRTYRTIYGALFRLCDGDADLAADLTQETYRKAWSNLSGFEGRCQISTWLYRIAYTTFLNHVRTPIRLVPLPEQSDEPLDPRPPQDQIIASDIDATSARQAVLRLPEELRFAVTAHFWGELSVREIARQQRITSVAVRKRLRKALRLLAATLEEKSR